MNKPNVTNLIKNTRAILTKNSPVILTALGIAGMIGSTVYAVKATPKAMELIEEKKYDNEVDKLTKVEAVKTCWKCYVPTVVLATASTACLIGATRESLKRNAALVTAYELSRTALADYKEKVIETVGEKKERAIKDKVAKERVERTPHSDNKVIITGSGNTLFLDSEFGTYFESDLEAVRKAINDINYQLLSQDYVSVNDFYDLLGIEHIGAGDSLGWNIGEDGMVEIDCSSTQLSKNGRPCIVLQYHVSPRDNYWKFG